MSELARFFDAVRFLTIVRVPSAESLPPDWLVRSSKYAPLVGLLIGAFSALVLLAASQLWTGAVPALLAVAASILVTGAFHEDGLADSLDALGGYTPQARLTIMKDSRIGTYGTLGLGLCIALRVAALAILPPPIAAAALVASHGSARFASVTVMSLVPYAPEAAAPKIAFPTDRLRPAEVMVAFAFALAAGAALIWLSWPAALAAIVTGAVVAAYLARLTVRLIGGYTGDVLGAIEQMFELAVLLAVAATFRL
jgi:adenosylcobinamide-GDP ribazoletransferase